MSTVTQPAKVLEAIATAKARCLEDEGELIRLVSTARMLGFGWKRIAMALGTSHQAAMERFRKYCDG